MGTRRRPNQPLLPGHHIGDDYDMVGLVEPVSNRVHILRKRIARFIPPLRTNGDRPDQGDWPMGNDF